MSIRSGRVSLCCLRGAPDGPLEFCPRQQIRQVRLQQISLGFVRSGARLPHIGNQNHALLRLIVGKKLALFAEFGYLCGNVHLVSRARELVS
jgi:hypothetical protein